MIHSLGEQNPDLVGENHFVAANATVIGNVQLMPFTSIWFNCVLRGDNDRIQVGQRAYLRITGKSGALAFSR